MKNVRTLALLFLLIHTALYSQDIKRLTLDIKKLDDGCGFCGNVYFNTDDGVSQCIRCEEGIAEIYFFQETTLISRAYITIRQGKDCIANMDLDCLLNSSSPIQLSRMSVKVKEYKSVSLPTDITECLKLLPNRTIEPKLKPDEIQGECYFPRRVLRLTNENTDYVVKWFSWNLQQLNEPVLCHKYPNEVYRFTWISNMYFYKYDPYSVRIEVFQDCSAILYCNYKSHENCENGNICCNVSTINHQLFEQFMQRMKEVDFDSNVFSDGIEDNRISFILETSINGKYNVIFRGIGEDVAVDELQKFVWNLTSLGENKIVHRQLKIE